MAENQPYIFHMEPKYNFLELVDIPKLIAECKEKWYNQTLCRVNDSVIRLGVFNEGEFHWHKHDNEDEFFFVIKGELNIEFEAKTVVLGLHQGITVPKGVLHRPFVKQPTCVIMVETDSVAPTGDT